MDFYQFIDSKDIREHLKTLNYQFTVPEAAFLVYHNETIALEEKFSAWQWMIEHMPDCSMEERIDMMKIDSFHLFLKNYMESQKRSIERFYAKDHAVYFYYYDYKEEQGFSNDYFQAFSSIESCMEDCKKEIAEDPLGILSIYVKKQWLDIPEKSEKMIEIHLNDNMQPVSVDERYLQDDEVDLHLAFERMWFDFPTPFQRGDLLCENRSGHRTVLVLDCLNTWTEKDMIERGFFKGERGLERADRLVERLCKRGDISDMGGTHYGVSDSGELYHEHFHDYLSLSYYKKPLNGAEYLLVATSWMLKGECDLVEFLNACMVINAQERINHSCRAYLPEWPEKLGILK